MEKRSVERVAFNRTVGFEVLFMDSGEVKKIKCKGMGIDINSSGLGVISPCFFDSGELIKVYIPVLDIDTYVPLFAQVIWSRVENEKCRFGVRFLS